MWQIRLNIKNIVHHLLYLIELMELIREGRPTLEKLRLVTINFGSWSKSVSKKLQEFQSLLIYQKIQTLP